MKKKLIAGFLLAGSCLFAGPRVSFGIGVGLPVAGFGYVAPAPVYVARDFVPLPAPGPGFTWTAGYWFGVGPNRVWRPGYWAAPRAAFFGPHAVERGHFRR